MKKFLAIFLLVVMVSAASMADAGSWSWSNSSSNSFQIFTDHQNIGNNQTIVDTQCYDIDYTNGTWTVNECDPSDYDLEQVVAPGYIDMSFHKFGNDK